MQKINANSWMNKVAWVDNKQIARRGGPRRVGQRPCLPPPPTHHQRQYCPFEVNFIYSPQTWSQNLHFLTQKNETYIFIPFKLKKKREEFLYFIHVYSFFSTTCIHLRLCLNEEHRLKTSNLPGKMQLILFKWTLWEELWGPVKFLQNKRTSVLARWNARIISQ